jgi:hypothetical protein
MRRIDRRGPSSSHPPHAVDDAGGIQLKRSRIAGVVRRIAFAGGVAAAVLLVSGVAVASAQTVPTVASTLAVTTDQNGVLPGSSFNVTGTGYDSCPDYGDRTVNVLWDGASMGVTVPIQSNGTFSAQVTVPSSAAPGSHYVYGQCVDGGAWARTAFTVAPPLGVTVTPTSGTTGSTVTVNGTGYNGCPNYGHRTVNVLWDGASTGVTAPIQSNGTFSARITVPSSAARGGHYVYGQCVDGGQWARTTFTVV